MAGLTTAESQATLDARFPTTGGTDYIAYSANGTSETASLARTSIGATGWAAATAADPSVKANARPNGGHQLHYWRGHRPARRHRRYRRHLNHRRRRDGTAAHQRH